MLKIKKINVFQYYSYAMIFSFLYLFFASFRVGIICIALMMILFFLYFIKGNKIIVLNNKMDKLIIVYFIWNILCVISSIINGYGLFVCFGEYFNAVFPVLFYFISSRCIELENNQFYTNFVKSMIFVSIVGLLLYLAEPNFYIDYLRRTVAYFHIDNWHVLPRMNSFIGSVSVGTLCTIAFAYVVFNEKRFRYYKLILSILTVAVILSMQRAAWGAYLIVLSIYILLIFKARKRNRTIKAIFVIIIFLVILTLDLGGITTKLLELISSRGGLSISEALAERNSNWILVFFNGINTFLGYGLGTAGYKARGISDFLILDGYFIKVIYEIGIIGLVLLICIIAKSVFESISRKKYFELCCIFVCCIVSIGSSGISFITIAPIFWFSVGSIFKKE